MARKRVRKSSEKQRLRRREGDVKRLEIVLIADSERDQYISKWIDDHLGRGEASEFTRAALEEKIARLVGGGEAVELVILDLAAQVHEYQQEFERLNGVIADRDEQLKDLREKNTNLWKENNQLRLSGAVEETPPPPVDDEDARQAALSGKMKKISFGSLRQ